jgi:hypothetical protein
MGRLCGAVPELIPVGSQDKGVSGMGLHGQEDEAHAETVFLTALYPKSTFNIFLSSG